LMILHLSCGEGNGKQVTDSRPCNLLANSRGRARVVKRVGPSERARKVGCSKCAKWLLLKAQQLQRLPQQKMINKRRRT
jgi:hypothetical protein